MVIIFELFVDVPDTFIIGIITQNMNLEVWILCRLHLDRNLKIDFYMLDFRREDSSDGIAIICWEKERIVSKFINQLWFNFQIFIKK